MGSMGLLVEITSEKLVELMGETILTVCNNNGVFSVNCFLCYTFREINSKKNGVVQVSPLVWCFKQNFDSVSVCHYRVESKI
jgi:hypothetical protein